MKYSELPELVKEKRRARSRCWYALNKEKANAYAKKWAKEHPERRKEIANRSAKKCSEKYRSRRRLYNEKTKVWRRIQSRNRKKHRLRSDICFKLLELQRTRLWKALKGISKSRQTQELIGCSISQLRVYLERRFKPGMTWENYGSIWHIDHIRPCAGFDLRDANQQRECFNFSNLQPLFAEENLRKGSCVPVG